MKLKESKFKNELTIKYIVPERIVYFENAAGCECLLEDRPRQAVLADIKSAGIKEGGSVLIDFGVEFQGGIDITVQNVSSDSAKLHIVFGESVSEAMSGLGGKNSGNDHAIRDMVVSVGNWSRQRYGNTGFRFVRIQAVGGDVSVARVSGVFEYRDIEYKGKFKCNDDLLNQIWDTGAYTVHLNMQEYLWDGIKRDRLVWIGDMHPEIMTIATVFGYNGVVPKSLDLIRDITPPDKWMNNIPSYTMQWIRNQYLWYCYTADFTYLSEQKEYLYASIDNIASVAAEHGADGFEDKFIDWSARDTKWERGGFCAVLVLTLNDASELCKILGDKERAKKCADTAAAIGKTKAEYSGSKQTAALAALAEMVDAVKINEEIIKRDGAKGLSAFLGCYVLFAMAKADDISGALDMIREYWGGMLKFGATTFWEDFDIAWTENAAGIDELVPEGKKDIHGDFGKYCYRNFRHSLCHGWASGATAFLSRYIAGIEMLEPGFKRVRINPNPCGLKYFEIAMPTPHGNIEVKYRNGDFTVNAPFGVEVVNGKERQ